MRALVTGGAGFIGSHLSERLLAQGAEVIGLDAHLADPRFATYAKRKANEDDLVPYVEPAVREWIAADIEAELMKQGVPCACVNNFKQVFEHPQQEYTRALFAAAFRNQVEPLT